MMMTKDFEKMILIKAKTTTSQSSLFLITLINWEIIIHAFWKFEWLTSKYNALILTYIHTLTLALILFLIQRCHLADWQHDTNGTEIHAVHLGLQVRELYNFWQGLWQQKELSEVSMMGCIYTITVSVVMEWVQIIDWAYMDSHWNVMKCSFHASDMPRDAYAVQQFNLKDSL